MQGSVIHRLHGALRSVRAMVDSQPHAVFAMVTLRELPLDPVQVRTLARAQRLAELGPQEIREVTPGVLGSAEQLAETARHSLESGCRLWVLSIDDDVTLTALRARFGNALVALGPGSADGRRAYGLRPIDAARHVLNEHPEHAPVLQGLDAADLPQDVLSRLGELMVSVRRRSAASRLVRDPRFYAYLLVLAYSALRALPVVFVKEFTGSVFTLWSIDIVTAIPYTWGVLAMATGRTGRTRAMGALAAVVTFAAPYVYFGLSGRDYPAYVMVVVVALVLSGVGLELFKLGQERRLRRRYEIACEAPDRLLVTVR